MLITPSFQKKFEQFQGNYLKRIPTHALCDIDAVSALPTELSSQLGACHVVSQFKI